MTEQNTTETELAAAMRQTADALERFSSVYEAMVPSMYPWTAHGLRHEANVLDHNPDETPVMPIVVDVTTWTRGAEIVEYARRRGINVDEAINRLVNEGLSHVRLTGKG